MTTATPAFTRGIGSTGTAAPVAPRPNRYGGKCRKCHVWVEAGHGNLTGNANAGWGVEHRVCQVEPTPEPEIPVEDLRRLPVGRFTVSFEDGSYKTLRVANQPEDASFMPGRQILSYLSGSSNDTDYTAFAHVDQSGEIRVWKKHQANTVLREGVKVLIGSPDAARLAYAEQSGACSLCGRTLTVPSSLHQGLGPECAKKV